MTCVFDLVSSILGALDSVQFNLMYLDLGF